MAKIARSARGEIVDFDILAITAAIASNPAPSVVKARRDYIDEKDGLRSRAKQEQVPASVETEVEQGTASAAMALAMSAAAISAESVDEVDLEDQDDAK